jgi:phosphatidylinositol glycan class A protein
MCIVEGRAPFSTPTCVFGDFNSMLSIALVCDFFFPAVGGAEVHLYQLGAHLARMGHRVVIVTHAVGDRTGVRYLEAGIKCYYLPQLAFYNNTSFPTIFSTLPLLRQVFVRERVQLVHGHSAFSVLAHEAIMHAKLMMIATCFTDHSLFGLSDASAILTNKLLQASLACTSVICVSNTSKQNTVLRAHLDPSQVRVISNSIDCSKFVPNLERRDESGGTITIAFCARLEMRKGADLLAQILAPVCERLPHVRFIIAGDGRKRALIEEVRDVHQLGDRVTLLGSIQHTEVPLLLQQAHIFLNTSLTEAFCMAILEAASCGCYVVSTNVGGIPGTRAKCVGV